MPLQYRARSHSKRMHCTGTDSCDCGLYASLGVSISFVSLSFWTICRPTSPILEGHKAFAEKQRYQCYSHAHSSCNQMTTLFSLAPSGLNLMIFLEMSIVTTITPVGMDANKVYSPALTWPSHNKGKSKHRLFFCFPSLTRLSESCGSSLGETRRLG